MSAMKGFLRALTIGATVSLGVVVAITSTSAAFAQADLGSVVGTVTDASGAVIANASITVTNLSTGAQRVTTTNHDGQYAVTQLPAAGYSVSVSAAGFATGTLRFTLAVGATRGVNLRLAVAGAQTQIVVSSDTSTTPDIVDGQVSTDITPSEVENLPLPDRDPYALVSLSGNISSQIMGGDRGVGYDIGGARSASVDILLDGAENTDVFAVDVGQSIPADAMQEFSVVIAGQGAEYGRASGGAVNVATKSGTNGFHGDAYEYNRISTFASDGFNNNALWAAPGHSGLSSPKPRYVHNQFGYYVGGPIKRNKLFFSSATEWTRIRSSFYSQASVPLPGLISMSAANMQAFFSTYGTLQYPVNSNTYTGAQMQTQGVYSSDITTIAEQQTGNEGSSCADAGLAGAPICTTPLFGTVVFPVPGNSGGGEPVNQWINFDRIDWTISDRTQVFGRYVQQSSDFFPGTNASSPYEGYNTGSTQINHSLLISLTHVFSPSIASATKLLGARYNNLQPLGSAPVSPTLYPNSESTEVIGNGTVNFPGYLPTAPGSAIPFGGPQNFIQIGEDLTWSKGAHTFKFGGEFLFIKDNRAFGAYENAVDSLVESGTSGGLINFINGNIGYENVAVNPDGVYPCKRDPDTNAYIVTSACEISTPATSPNFTRSNRYQDGAAYFMDNWRATSRLSVDAGLRWEVYGPQHSQNPAYDSNFFPGSGNVYEQLRTGGLQTRVTSPNGRMWNLNLKQFGPRLGVAYDLFGNGKSVIRAGYALSYERNFGNVTFNVIQNPPNYAVLALQNVPMSTDNLGAFAQDSGPQPLPNTTLRVVNPKIPPAYAQNWNLSIEHELGNNTLVTVGYIGSRGIHNYSIVTNNRQFSGGNYLGDASIVSRLNLQFGNINQRGADGDSYYNSLNVGIRSTNLHHTGLTAIANYTWSRSIDNNSSTFGDGANTAGGGFYLGYLDPFNHSLDRGPSDFDIPNRLTAGIVWKMPFFDHGQSLTKTLLGGWVASTTFNAETGNPYTLYDCYYAYTVCPRASFTGPRPKKLSTLQDISDVFGPNTYSYQNLPAYGGPGYNEWVNPLINEGYFGGTVDNPICCSDTPMAGAAGTGPGGFVTNMDSRNAYYGPGYWDEDMKVAKAFQIHERYAVNLSATAINVYNHANTFLNLNGVNDVSVYDQELAYKDGNRNMEFEMRFVF